jgi:hypothetical protein
MVCSLALSPEKKLCSTSQIPVRIVLSFLMVSMSLELRQERRSKSKKDGSEKHRSQEPQNGKDFKNS